jgi:hypothetical protein
MYQVALVGGIMRIRKKRGFLPFFSNRDPVLIPP